MQSWFYVYCISGGEKEKFEKTTIIIAIDSLAIKQNSRHNGEKIASSHATDKKNR